MDKNGDDKQREIKTAKRNNAEICKPIKKKARADINKYNQESIRETIVTSKSLKKVRRTLKPGRDRLITLLHKPGRAIHDHDKIIERIEEFYIELYDRELCTIVHTDQKRYQI